MYGSSINGFDYAPSIDDYKLVKAINAPLWYGRAYSHVGLISTMLSTGYSSFVAEVSASLPPLI